MKHKINLFLWAGIVLLLLSSSLRTFAGYSIFLKLDGIEGEATASGFEKQIVVTSFSHGVSNPATTSAGGGAGGAKATFTDLNITKSLDKASPLLLLNCAQGKRIASAVLTLRDQETQAVFYTVKLTQVVVTSVQTSGSSSGDQRPTEAITLNFSTIEGDYQQIDDNGQPVGDPVKFTWNLATNTKS